jgi:hypothetical protein
MWATRLANDGVAGALPVLLQSNIDHLGMSNEEHMRTMLKDNLKRRRLPA